jgi:hypothetical protein
VLHNIIRALVEPGLSTAEPQYIFETLDATWNFFKKIMASVNGTAQKQEAVSYLSASLKYKIRNTPP